MHTVVVRLRLVITPLLLALAGVATAADHTILGDALVVKNPRPGDPAKRRVVASAMERASAAALVGDPTLAGSAGGAVLGVIANGGTSTARAYLLPQGTASNGTPFWRCAGSTGFKYSDPRGEQGPVRAASIARTGKGSFRIKAWLLGKRAGLDIVPPDPGTDGSFAISLGGGDRYCVRFGPEGESKNDGEWQWRIQKIAAKSCEMFGELSLLNYNVAGLPEGISGSNPSVNMPLIAPLLNGYDVALVQESWETPDPNPLAPLRVYHEILRAGSKHPYASASKPNPLNTDQSRPSAVLSDGLNQFSRFPFGTVLREPWAGCDNSAADCLALKGFSMSRMTFAPVVEVDVYNFHMEAGGNPNDEALRDAGITQMLAFMAEHSAGRAIIAAGDANLHIEDEPDGTQYQRLLDEGGFTDACDVIGCPDPTRIEKAFFRSSDTVTLTALSWRLEDDVFVREDDEPLSDHPALNVRFRWDAVTD